MDHAIFLELALRVLPGDFGTDTPQVCALGDQLRRCVAVDGVVHLVLHFGKERFGDWADASQVQGHYKNVLEVEEAFCELKSSGHVRPVFHRKPERVINHVRICFLACWISAHLARQWRLCGETGAVTRILRQLQTIRLGSIHYKNEGLQVLKQITKVPVDLNAQLAKLKLPHLFAAPSAWAKNAEPTQP